MSKAKKKRDNQVYIKDIEEWKATVAKPILLVAEIFAPHFGPCEIMFPFIDELMTNLDNQGQADKVHWAIVNVSKLEDEKAVANAEDALKKQETKVGEKPKDDSETAVASDAAAGSGSAVQEEDEPDNEGDVSDQLDSTIPYLEKYAGFNHPTPHYLFFRNGVVIDELRGANPPRLEQLVRKWIAVRDEEPAAAGTGIVDTRSNPTGPVPPIADPDLEAIPLNERPRRGSMSLYAPDDEPEGGPEPNLGRASSLPPISISTANPGTAPVSTDVTPLPIPADAASAPLDGVSAPAIPSVDAPVQSPSESTPSTTETNTTAAESKIADAVVPGAETTVGAEDCMLQQEPPTIPI